MHPRPFAWPRRQLYAFDDLVGSLVQDGHVLGRENRTILLPAECVLYAFLPARDALEPFTWNFYVKQSMENLADAGHSMPQVEILGKAEEVSNACECPNSTWFILFTHLFEVHSPVKCGDCFQPVPLYRLPRPKDGGFYRLWQWAQDYKACDTLWLNASTGVRFGTRELSRAGTVRHHAPF